MPVRFIVAAFSIALSVAGPVQAATVTGEARSGFVGTERALDMAKRAIALRSVAGPGNQTPQVAALYKPLCWQAAMRIRISKSHPWEIPPI